MMMNSRKRILLFSFLSLFSFQLLAQRSSVGEYSINIAASPGVAYLYGDVAGSKDLKNFEDLKLQHVRYMISGGIRHKVSNVLSQKINFAYGHFIADEAKDTRSSLRGFAYDTQLFQCWYQPELTLLRTKRTGAYLFSGVGIVHSTSKMTGAPLRETDKFKESETAAIFPFGIGYEVALSGKFSLGTEITCFYYYSDFIDGFTTGYSNSNDVAGAVFLTFSYKIFSARL